MGGVGAFLSKIMNRLFWIYFLAFGAFLLWPAAATSADPVKPNILLIMADDLGYSDLGCYGSEIATPNLDSIAASGLKFTQFYNTARCWPTRGALLTGFYAQQIQRDFLPGVPTGGGNRGRRPAWAPLLPDLIEEAGYRAYHTGKWHIDGLPIESGFDRSYLVKDQGRFFNPQRLWKDDKQLPPVEKRTDFYATTALADHVIEVLEEHEDQHADAPFFHYLAFAAPHFPLHGLPEDIAIYDDVYQEGWDAIRAKRWKRQLEMGLLNSATTQLSRPEQNLGPPYHFPNALEILGDGEINKPVSWKNLTDTQKAFQAKKMAIHAAMIHRMDLEIGRVFEQIKKMGEWENTLVIFLSDNGASAEIMVRDDGHDPTLAPGSAGTYLCLGPGWSTACNTPFRRHKTWTHEGGTSTPFIVSWPKGISAKGELRSTPGHVVDVVPTLLELAGAQLHPDAPTSPGESLTMAFEADKIVERDSLWWFHDGHRAIRIGDWKAVAPIGEPWELYNMSEDRDESNDLAIPRHEKLAELTSEWEGQLNDFVELASADLPAEVLEKSKGAPALKKAQADAMPKRSQQLLGGKSFLLNGRHAFLMEPDAENQPKPGTPKPWIFYAPTLAPLPGAAESWMHQQSLDAGVAVAGIDVGEAYGSPHAFPHFEALYEHMVEAGYSEKPALLGRSRGGLWVSSWALAHPDRVAGIGGIYPVFDLNSYPGIANAAKAYGLSAAKLEAQQAELNPIKRAGELAEAGIPVFIIHGKVDKVVPLAANSGALEKAYEQKGAGELIEVVKIDDQGHNMWPGFFKCQELVDFLIKTAKNQG
ncbi:MAG: arylsulfatase A-like enzyme/pimeloyl-ACP methyl ester carboxylesterase [Verrucomicrobiales bacterium]